MGVIPVFDVLEGQEEYIDESFVFGESALFLGAAVYFIQAGDGYDGPVKIGVSDNVGSRFRALQQTHYEELYIRLICRMRGNHASAEARVLETHLHTLFEQQRVRGEWFRAEGELLEFMVEPEAFKHLVEGHDEPGGCWMCREKGNDES